MVATQQPCHKPMLSSCYTRHKENELYQLITNATDLEQILEPFKISTRLAIDTETTGLDPFTDRIRLLQLAIPNHPVLLLDLVALQDKATALLNPVLNSNALKIFQNAKFDLKFLTQAGVPVSGSFFDTMLASQVLQAGLKGIDHSLEALAIKYLRQTLDKTEQTGNWSSGELTDSQLEYAARDAAILLPLSSILSQQLETAGLTQVAEMEFACLPAFVEMELIGMKLDVNAWSALHQNYNSLAQQLKEELIRVLATPAQLPLFPELTQTVNLNSPKQVLEAFKSLGIPATKTNASHLATYAATHPVVSTFLEYRQTTKALTTYIQKLPLHIHPRTKRLHPDYYQLGTATGRASCSHPPLQQIPNKNEFRSCFVPEAGNCLISGDFSQIELRVIAKFAGEKTMTSAYMKGEDLHQLTASFVVGKPFDAITQEERKIAKSINFGLAFGMGAKKFVVYARSQYGLEFTLYQATRFKKQFFRLYPGLTKWHEQVKKGVKRSERTLRGRRRLWSKKPPFTELVNHPIQGSAADILKLSLGELHEALRGTGAKLIGTVHDEILIECPLDTATQAAQILERVMVETGEQYLYPIPVEVEIKIAKSWAKY